MSDDGIYIQDDDAGPSMVPPPPALVFTPQQNNVLDFVDDPEAGSAMVIAVAGAGKTTLLVEAVKRMSGPTAAIAFNKSIADELKNRMPVRDGLAVGTSHSFGMRCINAALGQPRVEGFKAGNLAEDVLNIPRWEKGPVVELVSLAKQFAMGVPGGVTKDRMSMLTLARQFNVEFPEGQQPVKYADLALKLLDLTMAKRDEIDFDDMIYMPLALGLKVPRFKWILGDEVQDWNISQRILVSWMLEDDGRLLAVGDPRQAIYGFRGADADSFNRIKETFKAKELPLTVTFRCPKLVVKEAQRYVTHIEAHETAPDGDIETLRDVDDILSRVKAGDAVLCRFNRPIVSLAFKLIRMGRPAMIAGRSIGMQLVKLCDRWKSAKSFAQLRARLEAYLEAEFRKAKKEKSPAIAERAADIVGTLFDMMEALGDSKGENISTVDGLKSWITKNYSDKIDSKRFVLLSTIHKSKGLEWDNVFFFGSEEGSPFAKQDWEFEQERNLKYVAITRAQKKLYLIPRLPKRDPMEDSRIADIMDRARKEIVEQQFDEEMVDEEA